MIKRALDIEHIEKNSVIGLLIALLFVCALLAVFLSSDPIIIAVTVLLVGSFLWFFEDITPIYLLYALCFGVSFLPYINLAIFPLSAVYVIAILFIGFTFISLYTDNREIKWPIPARWMILFLVFGVGTILIAPNKKQVIVNGGQFFIYTCIYLAIANIITRKSQVVQCIKYILYGSIIPLAVSVIQFIISFQSLQQVIDLFYQSIWGKLIVGLNGLERLSGMAIVLLNRGSNIGTGDTVLFRVFGTLEAPTAFGRYVCMVTILAGALYWVQRHKKRSVLGGVKIKLMFAALLLCLFFTWTRSSWIAFFVAAAFVLVYRHAHKFKVFTSRNFKIICIVVLIPTVFLAVFYLMGISLATEVVGSILGVGGLDASSVGRLMTILFALTYISNHPIVGIGLGNYAYANAGGEVMTGATFATAHNRFLVIGVELGLPGLLLFLAILFTLIKQGLALLKAPLSSFYHTLGVAFLAIWVGFLVGSNFAGSIIHPKTMTLFWIFAGLQAAVYNLYLNDQTKEHTVYRIETAH